jgi:hypothetical protein
MQGVIGITHTLNIVFTIFDTKKTFTLPQIELGTSQYYTTP